MIRKTKHMVEVGRTVRLIHSNNSNLGSGEVGVIARVDSLQEFEPNPFAYRVRRFGERYAEMTVLESVPAQPRDWAPRGRGVGFVLVGQFGGHR